MAASSSSAAATSSSSSSFAGVEFAEASVEEKVWLSTMVSEHMHYDEVPMTESEYDEHLKVKDRYLMSADEYLFPPAIREDVYVDMDTIRRVHRGRVFVEARERSYVPEHNKAVADRIKYNRIIAIMTEIILKEYRNAVKSAEDPVRDDMQVAYDEARSFMPEIEAKRAEYGREPVKYESDAGDVSYGKTALAAMMATYSEDVKTLRAVVSAEGDDSSEAHVAQLHHDQIWIGKYIGVLNKVDELVKYVRATYWYLYKTHVLPWLQQRNESIERLPLHNQPFLTLHELIAFRIQYDKTMTSVVISSFPRENYRIVEKMDVEEPGRLVPQSVPFLAYARAIANSSHLENVVLYARKEVTRHLITSERWYETLFDLEEHHQTPPWLYEDTDDDDDDDSEPRRFDMRSEREKRAQANLKWIQAFSSTYLLNQFVPVLTALAESRSVKNIYVRSMFAIGGITPYLIGTTAVSLMTSISAFCARRAFFDSLAMRANFGPSRRLRIVDDVPEDEKEHASAVFTEIRTLDAYSYNLSYLLGSERFLHVQEDRIAKRLYKLYGDTDDVRKGQLELAMAIFGSVHQQRIDTAEEDRYYRVNHIQDEEGRYSHTEIDVDDEMFAALACVVRGFKFHDTLRARLLYTRARTRELTGARSGTQSLRLRDTSRSIDQFHDEYVAEQFERRAGKHLHSLILSCSDDFAHTFTRVFGMVLYPVQRRERPPEGFQQNRVFVNAVLKLHSLARNKSIAYFDVGSVQALGGYAMYDPFGYRVPITLVDDFRKQFNRFLSGNIVGRDDGPLRELRVRAFEEKIGPAVQSPWVHFSHTAIAIYNNWRVTKVSFVGSSYAIESLPNITYFEAYNVTNLLRERTRKFDYFEFHFAVHNSEYSYRALRRLHRLISAHRNIKMLKLVVRLQVFLKDDFLKFVDRMAAHPSLRYVKIMFVVPGTLEIAPLGDPETGGSFMKHDEIESKIRRLMRTRGKNIRYFDVAYYTIRDNDVQFPKHVGVVDAYNFVYPKNLSDEQREEIAEIIDVHGMAEQVFPVDDYDFLRSEADSSSSSSAVAAEAASSTP